MILVMVFWRSSSCLAPCSFCRAVTFSRWSAPRFSRSSKPCGIKPPPKPPGGRSSPPGPRPSPPGPRPSPRPSPPGPRPSPRPSPPGPRPSPRLSPRPGRPCTASIWVTRRWISSWVISPSLLASVRLNRRCINSPPWPFSSSSRVILPSLLASRPFSLSARLGSVAPRPWAGGCAWAAVMGTRPSKPANHILLTIACIANLPPVSAGPKPVAAPSVCHP